MKNSNTTRLMEAARTELQVGGSLTHDPGRRALLGRSATAVAAGVAALAAGRSVAAPLAVGLTAPASAAPRQTSAW